MQIVVPGDADTEGGAEPLIFYDTADVAGSLALNLYSRAGSFPFHM